MSASCEREIECTKVEGVISSYNFSLLIVKLAYLMEASLFWLIHVFDCLCFISSFFVLRHVVSKRSCEGGVLVRHLQHNLGYYLSYGPYFAM